MSDFSSRPGASAGKLMPAERTFWQSAFAQASPQWDVRLGPVWQPASGADEGASEGARGLDVFVYAADLATGWLGAAAMRGADFAQTPGTLAARKLQGPAVMTAAECLIRAAGGQAMSTDHADFYATVSSAVCALACTQTFQAVRQRHRGQFAGHWVYMVYGDENAALIGRPVFGSIEAGRSFLSQKAIGDLIKSVVQIDLLARSDSAVLREFKSMGRVAVHAPWCPPGVDPSNANVVGTQPDRDRRDSPGRS